VGHPAAKGLVTYALDEWALGAILRRSIRLTGFWLEGARSSEEAELVSPRSALLVPLELVVLPCSESCFSRLCITYVYLGRNDND
jgi:hypothetical protein